MYFLEYGNFLAWFLMGMMRSVDANYLAESWAMFTSDRPAQPKCMDIPQNFTLCKDIQYRSMRLPNLLDHDTMEEAIHQSDAWNSLLRLHCHPDTKLFLCSLFAPVCLSTPLDKPIYPCQSLCHAVQKGCEGRMQQYGFPWPEILRCDKFPQDNDLCINVVSSAENSKPDAACKSCNQPPTFENILDNFCRSSLVLKARLRNHNGTHVAVRKARSFKGSTNDRKRSLDNQLIRLADQNESPNCPCEVGKGTFLLMANETNGNYIAKLIMPWDQKNQSFKGAIRKFRRVNCTTLGREIRESVLRQAIKRTVHPFHHP
uniref:Secreted frizzled-related protein 1 n=1 Tax=Acrobeloides nanus TaxID=290746 RepID=A0A914EFK6_9BILA